MEARFSAHRPVWRMLRHVLATMLLTGSVGTGAATACWKPIFTDEERRWIGDHPVVHIAVEANWHPIEYMRNGRHAGLVAGYLSAISRMTGLSFQTVPGTERGTRTMRSRPARSTCCRGYGASWFRTASAPVRWSVRHIWSGG